MSQGKTCCDISAFCIRRSDFGKRYDSLHDQRNELDRHFNHEIRRHGADLCESPREHRNYSVSIPGRNSRARPKQTPRPVISSRYLVDGKTARAGVLEGDRGAESPSSAPPQSRARLALSLAIRWFASARLSRFEQRQARLALAIRYGEARVSEENWFRYRNN